MIIGQYLITTNGESATEREGVSWGQTSTTQAWHNITNAGALPIGTYTSIFDDLGWIRGVKSVVLRRDPTEAIPTGRTGGELMAGRQDALRRQGRGQINESMKK